MKNINSQDIKIRNNITNYFYKKLFKSIYYLIKISLNSSSAVWILFSHALDSSSDLREWAAHSGEQIRHRSYFYVDHLSSTRLKINVTEGVVYRSNYVRFGSDQDEQGSEFK